MQLQEILTTEIVSRLIFRYYVFHSFTVRKLLAVQFVLFRCISHLMGCSLSGFLSVLAVFAWGINFLFSSKLNCQLVSLIHNIGSTWVTYCIGVTMPPYVLHITKSCLDHFIFIRSSMTNVKGVGCNSCFQCSKRPCYISHLQSS